MVKKRGSNDVKINLEKLLLVEDEMFMRVPVLGNMLTGGIIILIAWKVVKSNERRMITS